MAFNFDGIEIKTKSRRNLPLFKRDQYGLNARDRLTIKHSTRDIAIYTRIHRTLRVICDRRHDDANSRRRRILKLIKLAILNEYVQILKVITVEQLPPVVRIHYEPHNFDSLFTHLRNINFDFNR